MREFPDMLPLWGNPCPLRVLPAEKNQVIFDGEQINVFMIPPLNQYRFVNLIAEWYREFNRGRIAQFLKREAIKLRGIHSYVVNSCISGNRFDKCRKSCF